MEEKMERSGEQAFAVLPAGAEVVPSSSKTTTDHLDLY